MPIEVIGIMLAEGLNGFQISSSNQANQYEWPAGTALLFQDFSSAFQLFAINNLIHRKDVRFNVTVRDFDFRLVDRIKIHSFEREKGSS